MRLVIHSLPQKREVIFGDQGGHGIECTWGGPTWNGQGCVMDKRR